MSVDLMPQPAYVLSCLHGSNCTQCINVPVTGAVAVTVTLTVTVTITVTVTVVVIAVMSSSQD